MEVVVQKLNDCEIGIRCNPDLRKIELRKRNRLKLLFGCCSRQTGAESDIENVSDSEDCAFNE